MSIYFDQLQADHLRVVIVQFKKTSSSDERQKAISELTSKGAKIVNDDNVDSKRKLPPLSHSYLFSRKEDLY